jgi:hypothetical protein
VKRIKTRREYHDSQLVAAEWIHERDLVLRFSLDGHWNHGASIDASVMFSAVRNRAQVEQALQSLSEAVEHRKWLADVVGIVRDSTGAFLVDTSQGSLLVEAARFSEI